jgi:1-acyl-sn-glycerol-3-phosphate acyltransferase
VESKLKNIVHPILKLMIRTTASLYFEKVSIKGGENLPKKGPIIFACNHPSSFLDALTITYYYWPAIYYIARGDAFKKPFGAKLLSFLNNVPIFRKEEGTSNLSRNEETFDYCLDVLKQGDSIIIFSEGICENEWYLRPLRKGTARLVYEAWNDTELKDKLKVIPVSTNYSGWFGPGHKTHVEFMPPLEKEKIGHTTEQAFFMRKFNLELQHVLQEKVISIDKSKDVEAQNIVTGFLLKNIASADKVSMKVLKKFQELDNSSFRKKFLEFAKYLENEKPLYYNEKGTNIFSFLVGLIVIPIAFILNILPYSVCKYIAEKTTRKSVFYDSVFFGSLLFLGTIYMLLLAFISIWSLHCWLGIAIPIIALFSAAFYENAKRNIYCFLNGKKQSTIASMLKELYGTDND